MINRCSSPHTDSIPALHFKLAVSHDADCKTASSLDAAEFHYMPLLDTNRDKELVDLLPEYLAVDITFSRQHAWKFYTRVIDTLAKRRIDRDS
jgi:chromosome segregation protein Csm1/Pcs1